MTTDLLTLAQWLSPAYPVGAFAYSHGLETAIADGHVTDAETLQSWLTDLLTQGSAQSDAVLLARAYRTDDPAETNADARAFAASAERLREAENQGAAFAATTRAVWQIDLPDLLYPVAVGRAAKLKGLDLEQTTALYLHAFVSNLTSAAIRLVPLGQTEGQQVIAALAPLCEETATKALTEETLWSNTWASDIAAMRHETQEPRLFQS